MRILCHFCKTTLSRDILVSKNAKIFSLTGVHSGFHSYIKKCASCGIFYRYQDSSNGIHNFNDLFFMTFSICLLLREHVQLKNAISSFVEAWSRLYETNLNSQTVSNSYFLFELLSEPKLTFKCDVCGDHPWALVTDVNRKIAFKCSTEDIQKDKNLPEYNGEVDSESFWVEVELDVIRKAFSLSSQTKVRPSLTYWAPYMNEKSRNSSVMLNTEYKKISVDTGTMEEDFREMSEERILELLSHGTVKDVQLNARRCNVSDKGSKYDILFRIKEAIKKDTESFKKVFSKLWGHSGGWLTFSCLHGIVYYVKFLVRAESCRDYIDGILSFKHTPNVVIVDMAHIIASHASVSRRQDVSRLNKGNDAGLLFFPFDGRVADPEDPSNVSAAESGDLKLSFEWMDPTHHKKAGEVRDPKVHPVTGSDRRFCLFDRFHEDNTKAKAEALRRVTTIKELHGIINTQVEEQLHSIFGRAKHFLNMMKPSSHIFLFRSMLSHYNRRKNNILVSKTVKNESYNFDALGRIRFGNHFTLSNEETASLLTEQTFVSEEPVSEEGNSGPSIDYNQQLSIKSEPALEVTNSEPIDLNHQPSPKSATSKSQVVLNVCKTRYQPERNKRKKRLSDFEYDERVIKKQKQELPKKVVPRREISNDPNTPWNLPYNDSGRILDTRLKDKSWILSGRAFDSRIMEAAMFFLTSSRSTDFQTFSDGEFSACDLGFLQILNCSSKSYHWVVISSSYPTIQSKTGPQTEVFVFDPFQKSHHNSKKKRFSYSIPFLRSLRRFISSPGKEIILKVMDIPQAPKQNLTGAYSICIAELLSTGNDPVCLKIREEGKILESVVNFMEYGEPVINLFENRKTIPQKKVRFSWKEKLYCSCLEPDYGNTMKQCEKCRIWYHHDCEILVPDSNGKATCKRCRSKTSKTTGDKSFVLSERPNATESKLE